MGTPSSMPSRLDVILGEVKCELNTEEWVSLITKLIEDLRPHLKYLESASPLGHDFKDRGGSDYKRIFPAGVVFWPLGSGFNEETRIIRLGKVIVDESEPRDWGGKQRQEITEANVYLTRGADLIFAWLRLQRQVETHIAVHRYTRTEDEVIEGKLFPATMDHVRQLVDRNVRAGYAIVDNFLNAFNQNIGRKEKTLESMRKKRELVQGIRDRLAH